MKRALSILFVLLALAVQASAQVMPDTYIASVSGQATTAAYLLSIEAPAGSGFRLQSYCVTSSAATAAAAVTITVRRTTTASSGGTALTNEGTGTTAVSKVPGLSQVASFPGIARLNGTPGTAGAVIDQQSIQVPVITAGESDPYCFIYGVNLGQMPMPSVPAGTANGISINVSAAGAGGLASGNIRAVILMGQ